jgi:transposase
MENEAKITQQFSELWPHLSERQRRLFAASQAKAIGHGGVSFVSRVCGLSRVTITKGIRELDEPPLETGRVHKQGAGRPTLVSKDPQIIDDLKLIVEETTRGDPETPRLWTCKSTTTIAKELQKRGHSIGRESVANLLHNMGYTLQSNKKTLEGNDHPDRDEQFNYINNLIKDFSASGDPVVSVDTKKKELVGNYYNKGQQWLPKKNPIPVLGHDFPDLLVPRALPYGIYDLNLNTGYVNIGTDHDTGAFAVASIRGWWVNQGNFEYPSITRLLITADGGGSNGSRLRAWKFELQKLN